MNLQVRENEESLKKLEQIQETSFNAFSKIDNLIKTINLDLCGNSKINKEETIEAFSLISKQMSTIMNQCDDLLSKHYIILPNSTQMKDLPYYMITKKSDSLKKFEEKIIEENEALKNNDMEIDYENSSDKYESIQTNIKNLSNNLINTLKNYRKNLRNSKNVNQMQIDNNL